MTPLRRTGPALALTLCCALLAGCAPGPTPEALRDRAQDVFEALVDDLSAVDPEVLRAVETSPSTQAPCAGEDAGTQTSFVATGTLSITAEEGAGRSILDTLVDSLDSDEWDRIRSSAEGQAAWAAEDGTVITTTLASPALVVAVFTPCLP